MFNNSNNNNQARPNSNNQSNLSQDPRLSKVDPLKLKIIREIAEKSKGKSIDEMLPQIMKINKELQARNISFSKEETSLLMDVIEESLPAKDKMKFNMLKGFLK